MRVFLLVMLLGACRTPDTTKKPVVPEGVSSARLRARVQLDVGQVTGLSGMAIDGEGRVWAVPERRRLLLRFRQVDSSFERVLELPIAGIAKGVDTEALAWLGNNRLAFGTETQRGDRTEDVILIAEVGEASVTITDRITLSYEPWGMRAAVNRGIEGLCYSAGKLVIAIETVERRDGARFGPVAVYDTMTKAWQHHRLRLRTPTGKLSSLACRERGAGLEVLAIERHYGVARLLHFEIGKETAADIVPTELADLGALVKGVPNMEGVGWLPTGGIAILVDNDTGGVTGPTEIILIDL